MLRRLDAELVRRGLARSRESAKELIEAGRVTIPGMVTPKAASQVRDDVAIVVRDQDQDHYVSRGAHKLLGALTAFSEVSVAGKHALDAGASTGGFTQVLLERGAAAVAAVDVGYGVLDWRIRSDDRVLVFERYNVRNAMPEDFPFLADLVVADLSFISLKTVLPGLLRVSTEAADFVVMVKPQFEVGRDAVGNGVVRDPVLRRTAVLGVAEAMQAAGLGVRGVAASPLPGPSGNVEYFLWASRGVELRLNLGEQIERAVMEGPQ